MLFAGDTPDEHQRAAAAETHAVTDSAIGKILQTVSRFGSPIARLSSSVVSHLRRPLLP
jgi:hypothetical protein